MPYGETTHIHSWHYQLLIQHILMKYGIGVIYKKLLRKAVSRKLVKVYFTSGHKWNVAHIFAFFTQSGWIWYSRCPLKHTELLSVSWTAAQQMSQTNECSKSFCIWTSYIYCPVWVKFSTWHSNVMLFSICEFHVIGLRKTKFFVTSVKRMYLSVMTSFSVSPLHPSCFSKIPLFTEAWGHIIITVTVITCMGKLQLLSIQCKTVTVKSPKKFTSPVYNHSSYFTHHLENFIHTVRTNMQSSLTKPGDLEFKLITIRIILKLSLHSLYPSNMTLSSISLMLLIQLLYARNHHLFCNLLTYSKFTHCIYMQISCILITSLKLLTLKVF